MTEQLVKVYSWSKCQNLISRVILALTQDEAWARNPSDLGSSARTAVNASSLEINYDDLVRCRIVLQGLFQHHSVSLHGCRGDIHDPDIYQRAGWREDSEPAVGQTRHRW